MDRKLENWNSFYSISNLAIIKQFDFGVMVVRAFSIPIFESHAWFDLNLIKSISLLFLPFFLSSILRRQLSFHLVWGSTFTRPGPILWFFSILVPRLRTQISQVFVLSIRGKSIIENQMQIQIRRWQMMTIIYVHHVHHSSSLYEKKNYWCTIAIGVWSAFAMYGTLVFILILLLIKSAFIIVLIV